MDVIINGKTVIIPTTLAQFTLGQRIAFHQQYGEELRQMAESIQAMPEGLEKELESLQYHFESALRTFSFFSGFDVESLRTSEYVDDMAGIYFSSVAQLFEEEESLTLQSEFIWKDEMWEIQPPFLKHGSKMTTGEYVDAKQMLLNMHQLGAGRWESMLPLCAVYFRKKDEAYDESFIMEGSERQELMNELPMSMALQVSFFLTSSMNISIKLLPSSKKAGSNPPVNGVPDILKRMVGSTS